MKLDFLHSSHKMLYIYLAIRFRVSPNHVYYLAHSKREIENHTDHMIVRYFRDHNCFSDVKEKYKSDRPSV